MTFCIEARNRVSECVHLCVCLEVVASFCLPRGIFRENIQQRVVRYKCFEARRQSLKTHQRSLPRAAQGLGLTASMEDGNASSHPAISASKCSQFTMRGWTHLSLWHDLQSLQLLQCLSFQHLPSPSPEMTRWGGTKLRGNMRKCLEWATKKSTVAKSVRDYDVAVMKSPYMNIRQN